MSMRVIRGPRGPYKKTYKKCDLLLALADYRSAARAGRKITLEAAGRPYGIHPPPFVTQSCDRNRFCAATFDSR